MTEIDVPAGSESIELLSFTVGGEDYSININSTREIRGWTVPSSLPDAPAFVLGAINLRGVVLSLLDLAARLGLQTPEVNERSVIIVAEIGHTPVGLLVDAVSDIIAPTKDEMQPPPEVATSPDSTCVQTLVFVGEKIVRVLNLESVLPPLTEAV